MSKIIKNRLPSVSFLLGVFKPYEPLETKEIRQILSREECTVDYIEQCSTSFCHVHPNIWAVHFLTQLRHRNHHLSQFFDNLYVKYKARYSFILNPGMILDMLYKDIGIPSIGGRINKSALKEFSELIPYYENGVKKSNRLTQQFSQKVKRRRRLESKSKRRKQHTYLFSSPQNKYEYESFSDSPEPRRANDFHPKQSSRCEERDKVFDHLLGRVEEGDSPLVDHTNRRFYSNVKRVVKSNHPEKLSSVADDKKNDVQESCYSWKSDERMDMNYRRYRRALRDVNNVRSDNEEDVNVVKSAETHSDVNSDGYYLNASEFEEYLDRRSRKLREQSRNNIPAVSLKSSTAIPVGERIQKWISEAIKEFGIGERKDADVGMDNVEADEDITGTAEKITDTILLGADASSFRDPEVANTSFFSEPEAQKTDGKSEFVSPEEVTREYKDTIVEQKSSIPEGVEVKVDLRAKIGQRNKETASVFENMGTKAVDLNVKRDTENIDKDPTMMEENLSNNSIKTESTPSYMGSIHFSSEDETGNEVEAARRLQRNSEGNSDVTFVEILNIRVTPERYSEGDDPTIMETDSVASIHFTSEDESGNQWEAAGSLQRNSEGNFNVTLEETLDSCVTPERYSEGDDPTIMETDSVASIHFTSEDESGNELEAAGRLQRNSEGNSDVMLEKTLDICVTPERYSDSEDYMMMEEDYVETDSAPSIHFSSEDDVTTQVEMYIRNSASVSCDGMAHTWLEKTVNGMSETMPESDSRKHEQVGPGPFSSTDHSFDTSSESHRGKSIAHNHSEDGERSAKNPICYAGEEAELKDSSHDSFDTSSLSPPRNERKSEERGSGSYGFSDIGSIHSSDHIDIVGGRVRKRPRPSPMQTNTDSGLLNQSGQRNSGSVSSCLNWTPLTYDSSSNPSAQSLLNQSMRSSNSAKSNSQERFKLRKFLLEHREI